MQVSPQDLSQRHPTPPTWIIPYGIVSFHPASYLRRRDVGTLVWLGPVVVLVFIFIAYRFWLFGLRHYSSTGS